MSQKLFSGGIFASFPVSPIVDADAEEETEMLALTEFS